MATLAELNGLTANVSWDGLVGRVRAALLIKAYNLTELAAPTAEQLAYAEEVIANPGERAREVVFYVIAANSGVSVATIFSASDSAVQSNVDDAVDNLFAL